MTGWVTRASLLQIVLLFFSFGFALYFLSLFNGFVADDNVYVVGNPFIRHFNLAAFFSGSSYYSGDVTQLAGIYYKPVFTLVTSLLFNLGGGQPFLMHLVQVLIHITNSILLFLLFSKFFPRLLSVFLALMFLVHPGNVESVAYIADLQDVLFFCFGMAALLLAFAERITWKRGVAIGSFLLLSLLTKESGILFLPTIIVLAWVANRKQLKVIAGIPVVVFAIYLFLRFVVAQVYLNKHVIAPIMAASLPERLLTMPKIIISYICLFFFPLHLSWGQHWLVKELTVTDVSIPLLVIAVIVTLLVLLFIKTEDKLRMMFLFFLTMTVFGLGLHAQLIPLDFTFAERWVYFPMAGFLGLVGIVIEVMTHKKLPHQAVFVTACLVLVLLSMRTFIRVLDWKDDYTLASHDVQVDHASLALENNLGFELMKRGRYNEARGHLEKSVALYSDQTSLNNLAFTYAKLGDKERSLVTYRRALAMGDFYITYQNYIAELTRQEKYTEARKELKVAFLKFPNNPKLWLLLAAVAYNSGNEEEAITAAQQANLLSPGLGNFILQKIQNHEPLPL